MGTGASTLKDVMVESEDAAVLNQCIERMVSAIEENGGALEIMQKVNLEKFARKGQNAQELSVLRKEFHDVIECYMSVMEKNNMNQPKDVEQLASAQVSSTFVNLSNAERDDEEIVGLVHAFELGQITSIPESIMENAKEIKRMTVKKNRIQNMVFTKTFVQLQELDLSENELVQIPSSIGELQSLEKLNISENNITSICDEIGNLANLKTLIAFKNQLVSLPETIGNCKALEEVNFFNNKLGKVPNSISDWENIKDLNLGGNKLKTMPSTKKWLQIERLALVWNNIVMLNDFGNMPKLGQLQLARNKFSSLPDDCLQGCEDLETIDLSSCMLETLPSSITDCVSLQTLDVSTNALKSLPSLANFKSLQILKFSSNKISSLDNLSLGACMALETLFANDNPLQDLPVEIVDLRSLSRINIQKTQIKDQTLFEQLATRCKNNKGKWIV